MLIHPHPLTTNDWLRKEGLREVNLRLIKIAQKVIAKTQAKRIGINRDSKADKAAKTKEDHDVVACDLGCALYQHLPTGHELRQLQLILSVERRAAAHLEPGHGLKYLVTGVPAPPGGD